MMPNLDINIIIIGFGYTYVGNIGMGIIAVKPKNPTTSDFLRRRD